MKKTTLLKKLDEKVQKIYDSLYSLKELLDSVEDGELEAMADEFVELMESTISEGDINIESIKDYIYEYYEN